MGHAMNAAYQDVLVRWHRMRGFDVLWQPGYDHAGIATQNVVERELAKEGLTRQDLGREAFEARVWEWLERVRPRDHAPVPPAGGLARLPARALHDGRGLRAGGACASSSTSTSAAGSTATTGSSTGAHAAAAPISDLEVDHKDVDDTLSYVRYPLADGSGHVTVATVRPATILADVAVAVHPGRRALRRRSSARRRSCRSSSARVPIIADERVEPDFGTGALKITPGHDPLDFEIGREHDLPELTVIGLDGRMNDEVAGLRRLSQPEADRSRSSRGSTSAASSSGRSPTATRSATATAARRGSSR